VCVCGVGVVRETATDGKLCDCVGVHIDGLLLYACRR
jgi:hypothetical protein